MALIFLTMARLRLPFDMHFTQKTYYFQKIVTSPFLGQKLHMTHQNVRKKKGFYPIIITCLFCLLFLKKNGVDFFDNGEVTASLRYAFHTKNILFPKNCHVAVSGSKVTYDPSKCSQEKGLLPYYHNLFVMFVIFEKKWRFFLTMARLRLPFDMHFTQKTYYFQKIVTSPFLGQKLQMTHQNVRKKEGFYPIIITCLLCLLFLKKMATLEKNGKNGFFQC